MDRRQSSACYYRMANTSLLRFSVGKPFVWERRPTYCVSCPVVGFHQICWNSAPLVHQPYSCSTSEWGHSSLFLSTNISSKGLVWSTFVSSDVTAISACSQSIDLGALPILFLHTYMTGCSMYRATTVHDNTAACRGLFPSKDFVWSTFVSSGMRAIPARSRSQSMLAAFPIAMLAMTGCSTYGWAGGHAALLFPLHAWLHTPWHEEHSDASAGAHSHHSGPIP